MRVHALILVATLGCNPKIDAVGESGRGGSGGRARTAGTGGGSGSGGSGVPDASFGFTVDDAATNTNSTTDGPAAACAQSKVGAQQIPVDLLILLDNSGSMNTAAGMRSKWVTAQQALVTFVKSPGSTGLGVGLGFFPHPPPLQACKVDGDCPSDICIDNSYCIGSQASLSGYRCFPATSNNRCPLGGVCTPQGVCSTSKQACRMLDAPCPTGLPDDICRRTDRVCSTTEADSCDVAQYQRPSVPIAALPGNEAKLVEVINGRTTYGNTPTGVALRGAFDHMRMHLAANPGRRGAIILTTDGFPTTCMPIDAAGIAADVQAAQMGTPPISTYVIGVFSAVEGMRARPMLEMLATAGGTGMPFLLDTTADLGQRLNEALAKIRGEALPCEFAIPMGNGNIDFGKVNVTLESGGQEQTVPYVQGMAGCDPMRGGWYYDVLPAAGTPTRILACPATCEKFKAEREPKVSLVFGCETQVIK